MVVVAVSDGGYVVVDVTPNALDTSGDVLAVKFESSGDVSWASTYGLGTGKRDEAHSVTETSDGELVITGFTTRDGTGKDIILAKLSQETGLGCGWVSWTDYTMIEDPTEFVLEYDAAPLMTVKDWTDGYATFGSCAFVESTWDTSSGENYTCSVCTDPETYSGVMCETDEPPIPPTDESNNGLMVFVELKMYFLLLVVGNFLF